jgi:Ras-related C3 botulinum toxin substrate 1
LFRIFSNNEKSKSNLDSNLSQTAVDPTKNSLDKPLTKPLRIVTLGPSAIGKTCCITRYVSNTFDNHSTATIGGNFFVKHILLDGKNYKLEIWDTPSQERYISVTFLSVKRANPSIVLLFCSVIIDLNRHLHRDKFDEIKPYLRWSGEISTLLPPMLLVGTTIDLRSKMPSISYEEGIELAKKIGAIQYLECSASTGEGVEEVFTQATRIAADFDKAHQYTPEQHYQQGQQELEKKHYLEASKAFQWALKFQPDFAPAQQALDKAELALEEITQGKNEMLKTKLAEQEKQIAELKDELIRKNDELMKEQKAYKELVDIAKEERQQLQTEREALTLTAESIRQERARLAEEKAGSPGIAGKLINY